MPDIKGVEVEDASWMSKKELNHINVADSEAVLRGANLCIQWDHKDVAVIVYSKTVFGWVNLMLRGGKRMKSKGAAETYR